MGARSARIGRQDPDGMGGSDNFNGRAPFRSAPVSPILSPLRSPTKGTKQAPLRGNQVWCSPDITCSDTASGVHHSSHFDHNIYSNDSSPLHSPPARSPCRFPLSGAASPIHPNLSENMNQANVHPLPRPPGATPASPSTSSPQVMTKPEPVPKKNQWQKGKLIGRGTFGSVYVATNRYVGSM